MKSKKDKIKTFDPDGVGVKGSGIFGLPFNEGESEIYVLPVPWDVTVSYSAGTAKGPAAIFDASFQVDLYDPFVKDAWQKGFFMPEPDQELAQRSKQLRKLAKKHIKSLERGENSSSEIVDEVNSGCREMVEWVRGKVSDQLKRKKKVILLGGDHSTPLGYIHALAEQYASFGILQIDAHADLRIAYEDFEFSHASIMYNALKVPQVSKLVQVGIRDYGSGEKKIISSSKGRIVTFFDRDIKQREYAGETWKDICAGIISNLPEKVYISFDIDGLDPKLCPNTGTPVFGGFEGEQVIYLVEQLAKSGREIIGFDLNEVVPGENEWDANVGARMLYRIGNIMASTGGEKK